MKRKGLILVIAFAMLISIIPSFAFATENNSSDEAITKVKEKYLQAEAEYKQGPAKFLDDRMCENTRKAIQKAAMRKNWQLIMIFGKKSMEKFRHATMLF